MIEGTSDADPLSFATLQKRIHFLNKQVDVLFLRLSEYDSIIREHEEDLELASKEMYDFDDRIKDIKSDLRKDEKARVKQRLKIIENNLLSVERQLKGRKPDPKPLIPESTWEAFEEFLVQLNANKL